MSDFQDELIAFVQDARKLLDETVTFVEEKRVFVRADSQVDMVLGGHFTRVVLTTRSTLELCLQGNLFDSSTLARTVLEHMVNMAYLVDSDDLVKACAHFAHHGLAHMAGRHEALVEHFPGEVLAEPQKVAAARAIAELSDYQQSFMQQVSALTTRYPDGIFRFMADLPYSDYSIFAHPRPAGVDLIKPETKQPYRYEVPMYLSDCASVAQSVIISAIGAAELLMWIWIGRGRDYFVEHLERLMQDHPEVKPGSYLFGGLPDIRAPLPIAKRTLKAAKKRK